MLQSLLSEIEFKSDAMLKNIFSDVENVLDTYINTTWQNKPEASPDSDLSMLDGLDENEKNIAILVACRYIAPSILNKFYTATCVYPNSGILGGVIKKEQRLFIPSVYTACLLLEYENMSLHPSIIRRYLHSSAPLFKRGILKSLENDPLLADSELECTPEFIYRIVTGEQYVYNFAADFPATPVIPKQSWEDLVLPFSVWQKIDELKANIRYHQQILEHPNMGRRFKGNVLSLFSGEPGTGKTLTAGLLGRELNMPVYRIDLSRLVSKWVGETTKNLRNLFDVAENKKWILFFDEADSVFGKRSKGTGDANDHYHNQDISYLLQRIDNYKGFIILATNLGINIDDAFRRRIDIEITFMAPDKETRIALWQKAFSDAGLTFTERGPKKLHRLEMRPGDWTTPDEGVSIEELAEYWERATGAKVNKVMKRLLIESMAHNNTHLPSGVIVKAIQNELGIRKN